VQKAFNQVSVGRTSVVIAHRLGTIEENGRVVETGTKRELEALKGSFYKLYKTTI
jgi:ATP-binding cassette subfamily B protein